MKFVVQEIKPELSYLFIIGTEDKPSKSFRTRVIRDIDKAMSPFKRYTRSKHSVALVKTTLHDQEETEFPQLEPNRAYLIFSILFGSDLNEDDISSEHEELSAALSAVYDPGRRGNVSIVVLHDCTIEIIEVIPKRYKHVIDPKSPIVTGVRVKQRNINRGW